jgi:hypothetical protein
MMMVMMVVVVVVMMMVTMCLLVLWDDRMHACMNEFMNHPPVVPAFTACPAHHKLP